MRESIKNLLLGVKKLAQHRCAFAAEVRLQAAPESFRRGGKQIWIGKSTAFYTDPIKTLHTFVYSYDFLIKRSDTV